MAEDRVIAALKGLLYSRQAMTMAFAILDGASVPGLLATAAFFDVEPLCLYPGDLEPDMAEVAPYLVGLEDGSPFTEWVLSNGWGRHWGIIGTALADLAALRRHFRKFVMVYDHNYKSMYFRYYDPRVWRDYLSLCHLDELKVYFGPVNAFLVEDEDPKRARLFYMY